MSFVTLDFETYYASDFTLSALTTEEYIRDPRFEIIGVAVKVDDQPTVWFSGTHAETKKFLSGICQWDESALLAHNTLFDGAILSWILGIQPAYYYDTLSMARALHGSEVGGSLSKLVSHYQLGEKGTEVINAKGKRRADFTSEELERYAGYCKNDVNLTHALFLRMGQDFPEAEHDLIDLTLKMYMTPQLQIDTGLLRGRLADIKVEKQHLLGSLTAQYQTDEEGVRQMLASNPKFAEALKTRGVDPPMKLSPTTQKETFAFAKTDPGFIELQEHDDPVIQQLCSVRLNTKSTIEESRIERFIGIAERNGGSLPVPLTYYAAHTGRWGGRDSVNLQNLPSRDKKKKALKNAITARPGHLLINCDSSQIEARVLAWLAEETALLTAFRAKRSVYCDFGATIYNREITKADEQEYAVSKAAVLSLGFGVGWRKFQKSVKTTPPYVALSDDDCSKIVGLYRGMYRGIVDFWGGCEQALEWLLSARPTSPSYRLDARGVVTITPRGLELINGLYIRYPNLRLHEGRFTYDSRRGPIGTYGASVTENVVQALARIIVGEQMADLHKRHGLRALLTVHDALVFEVPEAEVDNAKAAIVETMSMSPIWAMDLPVSCEAKVGFRYGECS